MDILENFLFKGSIVWKGDKRICRSWGEGKYREREVAFALSRTLSRTRRLLHNWRILVKGHSWWMQRYSIGRNYSKLFNERHRIIIRGWDWTRGCENLLDGPWNWILKKGWWKIEGILETIFFAGFRGWKRDKFWNSNENVWKDDFTRHREIMNIMEK